MPLQPRTIPSHASEPIERGLIATTIDHRPEQRHGRPPTIPIIGTGSRMVIRAYRKPSDHPIIANVSGSAVRDRDPPIGDFFQKAGRFFQNTGDANLIMRMPPGDYEAAYRTTGLLHLYLRAAALT